MINPDRVHRAKAIVTKLPRFESDTFEVRILDTKHLITGWPRVIGTKLITVGDKVNIQAKFSIMLDCYTIKTISRIMERGNNVIHK